MARNSVLAAAQENTIVRWEGGTIAPGVEHAGQVLLAVPLALGFCLNISHLFHNIPSIILTSNFRAAGTAIRSTDTLVKASLVSNTAK